MMLARCKKQPAQVRCENVKKTQPKYNSKVSVENTPACEDWNLAVKVHCAAGWKVMT